MRGYHGGPSRDGLGEYPVPGDRGSAGIDVEGAGVCGSTHLQRAVGEIADEDRRLSRVQPQHRGAGCVPGRGPQPQRGTDLVVVRPLNDLFGFIDGRDAVFEDQAVTALLDLFFLGARRLACRNPIGVEVAVIERRHQVAGVGKRRHPGIRTRVLVKHGVPPDVIGVDVGVDHHVDGVAVDARRLQCRQETGVQVIQRRRLRAGAIIADPGVHDHGQAVDLDDPALDRDVPLVGVGVEEVRHQQVGVVAPPRGRGVREGAGGQVELQFHHPRHAGATEPDPAHRLFLTVSVKCATGSRRVASQDSQWA